MSTQNTENSEIITNKDPEPIIGIELGTKYCCVAIYDNNIIKILDNKSKIKVLLLFLTLLWKFIDKQPFFDNL